MTKKQSNEDTLQVAVVEAIATLFMAVSGQVRANNPQLAAELMEKKEDLLAVLTGSQKEESDKNSAPKGNDDITAKTDVDKDGQK